MGLVPEQSGGTKTDTTWTVGLDSREEEVRGAPGGGREAMWWHSSGPTGTWRDGHVQHPPPKGAITFCAKRAHPSGSTDEWRGVPGWGVQRGGLGGGRAAGVSAVHRGDGGGIAERPPAWVEDVPAQRDCLSAQDDRPSRACDAGRHHQRAQRSGAL